MDLTKINAGENLFKDADFGLAMQWLQTLVEDLTEEEGWHLLMKIYNEGFTEDQKDSLRERKSKNPLLVPANFITIISMTFTEIIAHNQGTLMSFGYERIKVRYYIGAD
ncbi:MAG: hypothetical protein EA392_02550 [Cryomorphaceae bacterium]|nr:MAG: hypothetical protein EA392_02550 [Cryomorphaceae bacterium]